MSGLQIFEIFIYELVDLLPNLILALLPFRDSLRLSKKGLCGCIFVLYIFLVCSRMFALYSLTTATLLTVFWIVIYLGFYIFAIDTQISKLLFVLLTILNYCSFIVVVFSYFAYHKFSNIADHSYSWFSSLVLALVYVFSYPMAYKMVEKIRNVLSFPENNPYWKFLWMVPATFCLSYYYNLYANGGIVVFSAKLSNVLFAVFFNVGALLVTYLVIHLLAESNSNLELKLENYHLNMKFIQYENLKERMEETRRAKHDLRQSLTIIQSCVQKDDKEGLLKYLQNYMASLPPDTPLVYCENYALNALIVYYADLASKHNIGFRVNVEYPTDSTITDTDASILLGNLLENALEACMNQDSGTPFVILNIKKVQGMLVITLDNSYSGVIQKEGTEFVSSKVPQKGIGTSSIKKITEKYQGILNYYYDGKQFHVSALLRL